MENTYNTKAMRSNRCKDTKPEREIRSLIFKNGYRFRKNYPIRLSNNKLCRIDIAFLRSKIAIFIDGCFWHGCPIHHRLPKTNTDYWIPKFERNKKRDEMNQNLLESDGWVVLRLWEHETMIEMYSKITHVISLRDI